MKLDSPLQEGTFLERPNRFAAWVEVNGAPVLVHVPNSGRMRELLQRGNRVLLTPRAKPGRKTSFDMSLVDLGHTLVSSDSRLPSALVHEAFAKGQLDQFFQYTWARREVTFSHSRLDMVLGNGGLCYVEMKSVTLVEDGVGLFPDAPTSRGVRHMDALPGLSPDPHLANRGIGYSQSHTRHKARRHVRSLVRTYGCRAVPCCRVSPEEVVLLGPIPVNIPYRLQEG